MKILLCLFVLMMVLSCKGDKDPAGDDGAGTTSPNETAPQRETSPQSNTTLNPGDVTIQRADVNEDGEVSAADVDAVTRHLGKKVPQGEAVWLFSNKEITVNEPFWVQVNFHGHKGERLDLELKDCDGFAFTKSNDSMIKQTQKIEDSAVGGMGVFIINKNTSEDPPLPQNCKLTATIISRSEVKKVGSFTQALKLRPAKIVMKDVDWDHMKRSGQVTATITGAPRPASGASVTPYVSFSVCRIDLNLVCTIVARAEARLPDSGAIATLQLTEPDDNTMDVNGLSPGSYVLLARYELRGGEYNSLLGTMVQLQPND